jgi:hypothetical protein
MIDNVVVVLQDCCNSLKAEPSVGTEAHPTSSYDNSQVTRVKVEPVTAAEQVGNPVQIVSPAMKREHQMSCVCTIIINTGHRHSGLRGVCMSDSSST